MKRRQGLWVGIILAVLGGVLVGGAAWGQEQALPRKAQDKLKRLTGAMNAFKKQAEFLEFRQQTEVFTTDKERELIEKIKQMKDSIKEQEAELEQNKEIRTKLTQAREFRKQASDLHAKVTEMADLAQKHHDAMVECYKKADKSREAADEVHRQFVEAQEAADAEHKFFIACQKELRDFDKVISGLRKKTAKAKVT